MKELSIEEKAKRYDEAIEIAKKINNEKRAQPFDVMTRVFPELKESEDERIRKWIRKELESKYVVDDIVNNEMADKAFAWLEKQGKQPHSYELEEEIEEWLGCEAFPEGTNITPLPKAMNIVRETANHFYNFGRKQQAIRNVQCTDSQVVTPESYINEGQKKGIQIVLDNPKEYGLQKKPTWSEEDEKNINFLCELLTDLQVKSTEDEIKYGTNSLSKYYHDTKEWLKSLRH